jgi:acyl-CoA thioesterase-1
LVKINRNACAIAILLAAIAVLAWAQRQHAPIAGEDDAVPVAGARLLPELAPVADVPGLPRVLLIGDSISIGYTLPVRKLLEGKANVHRIPFNGRSTEDHVAEIEKSLDDGKWDVIHFNWGLHDLKLMPDGRHQVEPGEYGKNLRALVKRLRATGARLIWATTTPVPEDGIDAGRRPGDVKAYNDIALEVMRENGVAVDDLNADVTPRLAELQQPHDVHYSPAGYGFLAKKVAARIEAALPRQ